MQSTALLTTTSLITNFATNWQRKINIAEFLRLIADTVGLETYLALLVVPGTARAVGKSKAKRIISERNISWAKGHADFFRQPWQDKAEEQSIINPADLVSRLDAMTNIDTCWRSARKTAPATIISFRFTRTRTGNGSGRILEDSMVRA